MHRVVVPAYNDSVAYQNTIYTEVAANLQVVSIYDLKKTEIPIPFGNSSHFLWCIYAYNKHSSHLPQHTQILRFHKRIN